MKKRIISILLLLFCIAIMFYLINQYQRQKSEITIQLSSIFNRLALPYKILKLRSMEPDTVLLIPIQKLKKSEIADSWGSARSGGRTHTGTDIFAARGTPIFSATDGYVTRVGNGELGGNYVFVIGKGGVRYYYAHLDSFAKGMESGKEVTTDTVLGFVGTTGNATGTPPHLHLGMYKNGAQNPYNLLKAR